MISALPGAGPCLASLLGPIYQEHVGWLTDNSDGLGLNQQLVGGCVKDKEGATLAHINDIAIGNRLDPGHVPDVGRNHYA